MRSALPAAGMLALPLAVAAALLALIAGAAGGRPPPPGEARVELEVAGVLPTAEGGSAILVLREKGKKTILPVIVTGASGRTLRRRVDGHEPPGALQRAIQALGGRVREVEISAAEEVAGAARILVSQGGREVVLDARPSESVPLAVAAGAPIYTRRRVLDEEGLTPDDLARARDRVSGAQPAEQRL